MRLGLRIARCECRRWKEEQILGRVRMFRRPEQALENFRNFRQGGGLWGRDFSFVAPGKKSAFFQNFAQNNFESLNRFFLRKRRVPIGSTPGG